MKILICGNGWVGGELKEYLHADMSPLRLHEITEETVSRYDVVINAAARTNIDWCELHKAEALKTNALDAAALARVCAKSGKKYVFISSACIFESLAPDDWKDESSTPNPACFYSVTKMVAEALIREACPEALVIRIRLPISAKPHPRNTLSKILGYRAMHTNPETVTVVDDMLPVFASLVESQARGIYHLVNDDTISPFEMRASIDPDGGFTGIPKAKLDTDLRAAGRAKRVTTLVRSTRIPPLPSIRRRMPEIAKAYKDSQ